MIFIYLNILDTEIEKNKFEKLYEKYGNLMHWIAKGILKDDILAEDAVHEAFMRILKNFEKIGDVYCKETKNYIAVIVRNVSLNMLKDRNQQEEMEVPLSICGSNCDEKEWQEFIGDISKGYDETEDEVLKKEIIKIIKELPKWAQEVIFLSTFYGFSSKEMSDALNITYSTARKRLERAREIIKERL